MENPGCSQTRVGRPLKENLGPIGEGSSDSETTTDLFSGLIVQYLSKLPQSFLISTACVMVIWVGVLNHIAGPEVSCTVLYLIPIALVSWFTKRSIGFILSILSAITWLIVDLTSGATFSDSDIPYWNGVARLSSFLVLTFILSALKSSLKQEKEFSRIDFLTGVWNRRYFIELLNMEIKRASRYKHPFTIMLLDLDNFKAVNDCFGHSTGDILLCIVARTISENIRVTDTVARLGGDEFAILLPETGRDVVEVIMQRIRKIKLDILEMHGCPVTLSIGVVTFTSAPSTVDETLSIADRLMYTAKKNGKNDIQYEVFGTREEPTVAKA